MAEKVGSQELPNVLYRVQLRGIVRQRKQADIVRDAQFGRGMPARTIQHEHGVRTDGHASTDLCKMCFHGLDVDVGHHDSGADATIWANSAKNIRGGIAAIPWSTWPRSACCPNLREGALLTDTGFVTEPDFNRPISMVGADRVLHQVSEAPLKASWAAVSFSGCCGRTDRRRKLSLASSLPMVRSWNLMRNSRSIRSRKSRQRQRTTPSRSTVGPSSTH